MYVSFLNSMKELLDCYCGKFGFSYTKMDVTTGANRKSLGSCERAGARISFNITLLNCKPQYIHYVVIHELCHTKHLNHRYGFWKLAESCLIQAELIPEGEYVTKDIFSRKADNPDGGKNFPLKPYESTYSAIYADKRIREIFKGVKRIQLWR